MRLAWLLIAILLTLAGCGREPLYQQQAYVFGTLVDITIYGEDETRAQQLAAHVLDEFQRLHNSLHAWKEGSDLDRVNQAFAAGRPQKVSPELAKIIQDATKYSVQSQGLFNPAIGHLINVWGFQRDEFTPTHPAPEEIHKWLDAKPQMTDIMVANGEASSRNQAVKLDLGGYAKGYALDLAAAYLRQEGVQGALINIGGNIIAIGAHGTRPWRVGIQHPRKAGPIATLNLPDGWAIGTSGDYQRYFEIDGKRYCHIIDPRTGYPAQEMQAVTVLIPPGPNAGTLSDVTSKPLFISGRNGWRDAAKLMGVNYALVIDAIGTISLTPEMRDKVKFEEKTYKLDENNGLATIPSTPIAKH
ncbi:FAD:protein FMN transferase [Novimethylophilus kurashikiensis]|uniref:FAD:protein FMN transferase n=1 Tax=Novimethylophilus kurashikiensis TaxID=1825523 RepID=A0A2R5F6I3_9PROT|nr:FAD:protein FMN transferase [Novimethylophilus kurashikiensis]GBG13876.1 FAD:protein FMN transferase [Novimethylophilus kurashikiensis]